MQTVSFSDTAAQQQALDTLRDGGVMIFPTDTVYGVGGDATNPEVQKRVAELKRRPPDKPFPWLVADMEMAKQWGEFTPQRERMAQEKWPGSTTLVVPLRETAGTASPTNVVQPGMPGASVGLRVPDHDWLRGLIHTFGKPIIGTSANPGGKQPATSPDSVEIEADLLIDGGVCSGTPSEVIDATVSPPKMLRARP